MAVPLESMGNNVGMHTKKFVAGCTGPVGILEAYVVDTAWHTTHRANKPCLGPDKATIGADLASRKDEKRGRIKYE
jgi:hypothetical protein